MTGSSQEDIALELMKIIAAVEKKSLQAPAPPGTSLADRSWILRTFSDCVLTVRKPQAIKGKFDPL